MQNPLQFMEVILRVEQQLSGDPPYFLTSVDNPNTAGGVVGGKVFDLPDKRQAARLVAGGTHRVSTPEEIDRFHADLRRQTDDLARDAMARKQQFAMPPEIQTVIGAAAEIVRQQAEKQNEKKEKK